VSAGWKGDETDMRLLIIGPQGAGKGTQATLLCRDLGIPHVSTGDLFRANIGAGTDLGRRAQEYMKAVELVPDSVTQDMVSDRLAQPDAAVGFLLDGFPRNIAQADWLTDLLAERGTPIDAVVVLTAPDEVLTGRMLARGRADDTPEAIRTRLDIYYSETQPLVDYYDGRVLRIDGVGEIDAIHARIMEALSGATVNPA
jgi:adenylate kinase